MSKLYMHVSGSVGSKDDDFDFFVYKLVLQLWVAEILLQWPFLSFTAVFFLAELCFSSVVEVSLW